MTTMDPVAIDALPLDVILRLIIERLEPIDDDPDACWRLRGATQYPRLTIGGITISIHRFICGLVSGAIPAGWVVDHECHNRDPHCRDDRRCPHRRCIRPDHLVLRTAGENIRRGRRHEQRRQSTRDGVIPFPAPLPYAITEQHVAILRRAVAVVAERADDALAYTADIGASLGMTGWELGRTLYVFGLRTRRGPVLPTPDGKQTQRRGYIVGDLRAALDAIDEGAA